MKKAVALLIIAIFLPQQLCLAGITDDFKSTLKSNFPRAYSTAQSAYNYASSAYTAASNVSGAIQQATGISARDVISSPGSFIATKLGISAINNYRNLTTNNLQTYSQPISSTTIQSHALSPAAFNSSIPSLPALSTQSTLSSDGPCNNGGPCFNIDRNPNPSFFDKSKQLFTEEWFYKNVVSKFVGPDPKLVETHLNDMEYSYKEGYAPTKEMMRNAEWNGLTLALYVAPGTQELGIGDRLGITGIKFLEPITQTLRPFTSRIPLRQGFNYVRQGSDMIWGNRYAKIIAGVMGTEFVLSYGYGLSPWKSPAYNAFADNSGRTSFLMNEIRKEEHLLNPGKYNDEMLNDLSKTFPYGAVRSDGSYDRVAGPFGGDVFSYGAATPEKIKRYFEERGIKTNDRVVAYTSEIVSLNTQNQDLFNNFNSIEKVFTYAAELNSWAFNSVGEGIKSRGIPLAGDFIRMAGSYTPLSVPSIGASVGANPSQGFRGILDFTVNPVEAGIGLRRGSIVDLRWDYDPGYRNLGEAAGSAFILYGGGRQAKGGLGFLKEKIAKTDVGEYLGKTKATLLASHPDISSALGKPWVKPLVYNLAFMGPLIGAAYYQGWQSGDLGTPAGATAVMGVNMFGMPFITGRLDKSGVLGASDTGILSKDFHLTKTAGGVGDSAHLRPITPDKLRNDQVSDIKKMITGLKLGERMAVIRDLGSGKTKALLSYVLPFKIGANLKADKVTFIFTPNAGVTQDVAGTLKGANEARFSHKEIQKKLGINFDFDERITSGGLKIESITGGKDNSESQQEFIHKVMTSDVVVMPWEQFSSIYHTFLAREAHKNDPAMQQLESRIKDSFFFLDEVDLPAFLPSLMISKGRTYVGPGHPEYSYWQDVARRSEKFYRTVKWDEIDAKDMAIEKKEGESSLDSDFRQMAQVANKVNNYIPRPEDLPASFSPEIQKLAKELITKYPELSYKENEIAQHIAYGILGHRAYNLRSSFRNEEYAVKTRRVSKEEIDAYNGEDVNTVVIGGVEGRDIHNFDLHIPAGEQQVLEILHGAKLISKPLKGDYVGRSTDALNILGGGIGFTATLSETVKPILKQAGFKDFDYGKVKTSDFEAPTIKKDLSDTVRTVVDDIVDNKGNRLDIDITAHNLLSRLIVKTLRKRGVKGKYIHIGGRTSPETAQKLLDSLKGENAPYAIIGTANLIGRGLNFDAPSYLAKDKTKVVVNLIEPEQMTATQVEQGAGRIGGQYRFTNIKNGEDDKKYNPEKIVRLIMSREMLNSMPEFREALRLDDNQEGIKSIKFIEALRDVWNKNEKNVVAKSGLASELIEPKAVKSEFKLMDVPVTLDGIKDAAIKGYFVDNGYVKENRLTIKGLRFMQLVKEIESLSAEQKEILDKFKLIGANSFELAKELVKNNFVQPEEYSLKGLTSVIRLGRIFKPFDINISEQEINNYQNILPNGSLEPQLDFIKDLIIKERVKIEDAAAKKLILEKLELFKQALIKIQAISQEISVSYVKNNGKNYWLDRLHLKSAYKELENIIKYNDLKAIADNLNYPTADLASLFIPTLEPENIGRLNRLFGFIEKYDIKGISENIFELLNLSDDNNKTDFAEFVDKHTESVSIKTYAKRMARYQKSLIKQVQYAYSQLFDNEKAQELRQGLWEDVEFFKQFNIDLTKDTRLNLEQLKNLAGGEVPDELLLRLYLGLGVSEDLPSTASTAPTLPAVSDPGVDKATQTGA